MTMGLLPKSQRRLAGIVSIAAVSIAFLLSLWALDRVIQLDGARLAFPDHEWLAVGQVRVDVGLNVDSLTAIMLVIVTSVSLLVQFYSQEYMAGDGGYIRYYAFLSLFTGAMLGLVLADNLIVIYAFWELVGVSSFLLIGFWFHRPAAAAAAKEAFLVTRLGDIGFLLAILLIYVKAGTFDVAELQALAVTGALSGTVITAFALGTFAGAAGKSAQMPLHVWLPDAMEGPTPVSALIHAATMVAAGVYLVARLFPVFDQSSEAMAVVGAVGGITAIASASMALVMTDLKRVLAYSTISQLGYMMLALGVGGYVPAVFHLLNNAFFKALLFLGAGSINHATNTNDLRLMGGLRRAMPLTFATFVIAALSLAGIFPLSGFWSKDEIISAAYDREVYLFVLSIITVALTGLYMFRVVFLAFGGEYRGGEPDAWGARHANGPRESGWVMLLPLLLLGVPTVYSGFLNVGGDFGHFLEGSLPVGANLDLNDPPFRLGLAIASTAMALGGIGLAWVIYSARMFPAEPLLRRLRPVHALLENRFYFDDLYERAIVGWLFYRITGGILSMVDRLIDSVGDGVALSIRGTGTLLRRLQTGQFQFYGTIGFTGLLIIAILVLL